MDILYVVTKSGMGGASRYVYDVALEAAKHHTVRVAAGGNGALFEKLKTAGIETISIPYLERDIALIKEIKVFFFLIDFLVKQTPDVVHLNSPKIGGLGALAARIAGVKKIIYTAHGWPFYEDRSAAQKTLIKFASWITVVLSTKTIAVSTKDAHAFDTWLFTAHKIVHIPNGIRPSRDFSKQAKERLKEKIPELGKYIVGSVAELHKNKGITYLIQAANRVPEATFVVIGEGEERKHLEQLIQKNNLSDRFHLLGYVSEAHTLMSAFNVFVLSSEKEGLPFVLLEAGIQKIPVVATYVGGISDLIEDKKSGLLVEPKNPVALARAIQTILNEPTIGVTYAENLKKNIIETRHTFEKMFGETTALYN